MNELYIVEMYLLEQLSLYVSQKYFWNNIISIIINILKTFNGTYEWNIENNIIIIKDEFTLYPENFKLVNGEYIRLNYISIDYNITPPINNTITIGRDPNIVDTELSIPISNSKLYSLYGTNMNNVIKSLLDISNTMFNISTQPLNYNYMDSIKYYITKLYNTIIKDPSEHFNKLTTL